MDYHPAFLNPLPVQSQGSRSTGKWKYWIYATDTRFLKNDSVWNYVVTTCPQPLLDGTVYLRPLQKRTRVATGETEKIEYSDINSTEKFTDVLGNVTTTYTHKTAGLLYEKPYKITRKRPGDTACTTIWRACYDTAGYLISTCDADGNHTT